MVRLVRSLALTLREQLFVEAAHAIGTRLPVILVRHVLPNIVTPLIVQATFIAATAVLTEAVLSFLGVGVPRTGAQLGQHDGRRPQLRGGGVYRHPVSGHCRWR